MIDSFHLKDTMKVACSLLLLLLVGCDQFHPTPATQTYLPPRYQVVAVGTEADHAWKLDTQTGDMWLCVWPPLQQPLCHKAKME